ncbi:mechanosensitive ion channel protein 6-like [Mercurialis annua]|uniref:mechanosensitive ion channel protein 6-like n=1 Tax=Mercurialis annua TaxID=3986 RepID=UPI00215F5710|nr:mechanosensitive ion channel protein 6-like [Mercurialis annua]
MKTFLNYALIKKVLLLRILCQRSLYKRLFLKYFTQNRIKLIYLMDSFRKSLRTYCSQIKQQQNYPEPEEEKQALLDHQNNSQMSQSAGSPNQKDVILNIDDKSESSSDTSSSTKKFSSKFSGSSSKLKVSFEDILQKAVRQRRSQQDSADWSTNDNFQRNSWRSLVNRTKSRLIDPPEVQYQRADGAFEKNSNHGEEDDDMDDNSEEYKKITFSLLTMFPPAMLVLVTTALVCTLSISPIRKQKLWDFPLWKWEILILSLICGNLVSGWGTKIVVIFIEHKFLFRQRVLYFVYGLRKPVQNCLWLCLVLLVWHWIFNNKADENESKILQYVTKILVCLFVGTFIWLLKTLIVKALASSFHVNTFFDRIQEALFDQYVIEALSGPPLYERQNDHKKIGRRPSFSRTMSKKKDDEVPIDQLHNLNHKNISALHMRRMINIVRHGSLSTLDEQILNSDIEDESLSHIRSECQAREAAKKIFLKVSKAGSQYIFVDDLMRFMAKEEALRAMRQLGAECENEGISKSSLNTWLVNAFRERRALALSLNDTKTAVDELHTMLNILVAIIIAIIWLLILGVPIAHFLVLISSQLLLVAFVFGNSCKTTFEAIIFLFVMHPFDVGDCVEVDGVKMVVEEMNILTTVFLRADNQKITYPNNVLATKPIGNFYRSPHLNETIDFSIHISTPMEKIDIMKDKIKEYVEGNSEQWHPNPKIFIKDVEDMNKMDMSLWVSHTINYQRSVERWSRRSLLLQEMIKVFKELEIEYRLLPLDVNVRNLPPLVSDRLPSNWSSCAT